MSSQCLECLALDNREGRSFEISVSLVFYTRLTDPQHFPHIPPADTQSSHSIPTTHFPQYQYRRRRPQNLPIPPTAVAWVKEKMFPISPLARGCHVTRRWWWRLGAFQAEGQVRQGTLLAKKDTFNPSQSPGSHRKGGMPQKRLLRLLFACLSTPACLYLSFSLCAAR